MAGQILIAEDNDLIREHIREELAERGYAVAAVASGQACLDRIKTSLPDILILDIMMPGITGLAVLQKIRTTKRFRHIYVIANTVLTKESREGQVVASLVDDYIEKPARMAVLLAAVNRGVGVIEKRG